MPFGNLARRLLHLPPKDLEAEALLEFTTWQDSMRGKNTWCFTPGPLFILDCPVEDLIYPYQSGAFFTLQSMDSPDDWFYTPPWTRQIGFWRSINSEHLQGLISKEYHDATSPAKEDARSLRMDEREYGYYMALEYLRARKKGRRSRLDDVAESHGGAVEDFYDWDGLAQRGIVYDDSWGREHPSIMAFRQGKGFRFYYM
ncbi:MAG: hypothetical protein L6R40_004721 [Gallowayella cf. fulva]|nr:MAG: hypothetical protein L6R40_004721 [Xanthomendoza cf. fulva]